MDNLLDLLNGAVSSQDWLQTAAIAVLVALSLTAVVLKALKKPVPLLDTLLDLGKGLLKVLPKKSPPPPADPAKDGLAAVVKFEDKRGPPEP